MNRNKNPPSYENGFCLAVTNHLDAESHRAVHGLMCYINNTIFAELEFSQKGGRVHWRFYKSTQLFLLIFQHRTVESGRYQ